MMKEDWIECDYLLVGWYLQERQMELPGKDTAENLMFEVRPEWMKTTSQGEVWKDTVPRWYPQGENALTFNEVFMFHITKASVSYI